MELSDNHSKYLLQPGQRVEGTLDHKEYKIHFKSSVMRVNDQGSIPWYGLSTEIDQTEDLNHYLELIYDGQNKFVAGEQDNWITTLDELNLNIILHLKAFERSFMKKFIKNNINIEE